MNRRDFQKLALIRIEDARVLFRGGRYDAAYYLAGYAVECALKACIAKQTMRHDFPPDRGSVDKVYRHQFGERIVDMEC
jgi:HEPN domain-containing protein